VAIFLEELKAAYPGFSYNTHAIDISKNTQKEPWFIKVGFVSFLAAFLSMLTSLLLRSRSTPTVEFLVNPMDFHLEARSRERKRGAEREGKERVLSLS